ncbi:MAG: hypothetical protein HQ485_07075 [Acidobacteria bacterium]|nr:hypothetical protein [Acidobacteriota bacterium]
MTRTGTIVGIAALVVAGAAVVTQAQGPQANAGTPGADDQQRPGVAQLQQRGPQGRGLRQGLGQRPAFPQGQRLGQAHGRAGGFGGAMRGGGPGRRGGGPGALRGLDLTEEQRAQVKAIHEQVKLDVEALLTPEQLEKLKSRGGRDGGRGGGER